MTLKMNVDMTKIVELQKEENDKILKQTLERKIQMNPIELAAKRHADEMNKIGKMHYLVQQVEKWSMEKELHKSESSKQFLKVTEEVGEVAAALARGQMEELQDGIGDVVVTLIILAQQNGLTLEECLEHAYNEIAGRKGKMINGVFVKEEILALDEEIRSELN